ncbi:hypothetical protein DSL72_007127 [Monilinia vaccinii-corymbosi]|uniref:Protein Zds1 C-terminal domain-containing protein n=1 Tax=Monilinia vaccinii-corymbosi TaxID=61207 RepID=A0A8A3PLX7_9HELO|nr:hypothetical protein DSL72_007127 [Monilinia vaccinii-corymbosi]
MYGDDDYSRNDSRPLSFMPSSPNESIESTTTTTTNYDTDNNSVRPGPSPLPNANHKAHTSPAIMQSPRSPTVGDGGPISPSLSLRDPNAGGNANAEFPLNDIDYESGPAAVAQELSNLQALRRMSMDVGNTSDPDLPSFQGVSSMPAAAPTGEDDEGDPSRLFWVPARVHPELAPMEFKTFLENRVQSIKRRSGDQTSLTPNGIEQGGPGGGLTRKKSMLSRQIDNSGGRGAVGYKDGAEHLERQKSLSGHHTPDLRISDLQELDELVRDPSKAMQQLNIDTGSRGEGDPGEDLPILPQGPGIGLRRSTRTTYRRGSLRKGDRVPFSKRAGSIRADTDGEDSPTDSPIDGRTSTGYPLTHTQSEPSGNTDNFSRPNRSARRMQNMDPTLPISSIPDDMTDNGSTPSDLPASISTAEVAPKPTLQPSQPAHDATQSRSASLPRSDSLVPRIVETPPPTEESPESQTGKRSFQFPERTSSQTTPSSQKQPIPQATPEPPVKSTKRPALERQAPSSVATPPRPSAANDMHQQQQQQQQPSPLPVNASRTDAPSPIPPVDDKRSDKKGKKEKEEESSGSRKTSWAWFKGSDEKDKKDKKKDDKSRSKVSFEKTHDNARLDVLQSTMETTARGRESFLVERDNVDNKLENERKKESTRRAGEPKREKDGIFSSLFGGGKKKAERDPGAKKGSSLRTLSPEPTNRVLKPDIDYNWTRFSIMEERAIYRMAHIKLANPKRALYSQVLLSNFMYSYLAKVQQMHPHMQVPQSALQKKAEAERKQKEQEQKYREQQEQLKQQQQQQQQEGGDQYRYDYHQGITQYAEQSQNHNHSAEGVDYVDDSQIYDHDHKGGESGPDHIRPQSRTAQNNSENGYNDQ